MIYQYENVELELLNGRGVISVNNKLVFKGHGYLAIKEFIRYSNNAPAVIRRFKDQLNMREKPKFRDLEEKQKEYEEKLPNKKEEFKITLSKNPRIASNQK
tara:strand:+ start:86 stop:388 length:303 start_codon:yes stop_codon:yes gene_type:complete